MDGNRLSKTQNGQTTFTLYLGEDPLVELDSQGNVLNFFDWGLDGLLGGMFGGVALFGFEDPEGNLGAVVNSAGAILSETAYTGWGSSVSGQESALPFGWQGAYQDSGQSYRSMEGQPYIPNLGSYASPSAPGYSAGVQPYLYGGGDPINGGMEEAADADILPGNFSGEQFYYNGFRRSVNRGAGIGLAVLSTLASMNPIEATREILFGNDALGHKLSWGQRLTMLAMMVGPKILPHIRLPRWFKKGGCFVAGTLVQTLQTE